MTLQKHLSEIMGIVGHIQKDAYNSHFKYKYASAAKVFEAVRNELTVRGIVVERDLDRSTTLFVSADGGNVVYNWAGYFVLGDERVPFCGIGQGADKGDKAAMKAATAALKYALAGTFFISWDDDPENSDNDASAPSSKGKGNAKTKTKAKKNPDLEDLKEALAACTTLEELGAWRTKASTSGLSFEEKAKLTPLFKARKADIENGN